MPPLHTGVYDITYLKLPSLRVYSNKIPINSSRYWHICSSTEHTWSAYALKKGH